MSVATAERVGVPGRELFIQPQSDLVSDLSWRTENAPTLLSTEVFVLISGTTCGGKSTLLKMLLAQNPHSKRIVTTTSRTPRSDEQHGVDYFFMSRGNFEEHIHAGDFFECAEVYGNYYGSFVSQVRSKLCGGSAVFHVVDVQGHQTIREKSNELPWLAGKVLSYFVGPEDIGLLRERWIRRSNGAINEEEFSRRVAKAENEMKQIPSFDGWVRSVDDSPKADYARFVELVNNDILRFQDCGGAD